MRVTRHPWTSSSYHALINVEHARNSAQFWFPFFSTRFLRSRMATIPAPSSPPHLPSSPHTDTSSTSTDDDGNDSKDEAMLRVVAAAGEATTTERPTWPDPAAISTTASFSPPKSLHGSRKRSSRSGGLVGKFEINLADHLAEFLSGKDGQTLKSIYEASGIKGELVGKQGSRKLVGWGSSSAVTKAKQLVDARLSQTPLRLLLAVRLQSETSSLRLRRSPASSPDPKYPLPQSTTFHIVESSPMTPNTPQHHPSSFSPLVNTPASERSGDSFFSSSSGGDSRPSSVLGQMSPTGLPTVGSWGAHQTAYIDAVVQELQGCVSRSSLVKLKFTAGTQMFQLTGSMAGADGVRLTMEEVSRWKIEGVHRNLSPHFSPCLSRDTIERFRTILVEQMNLTLSRETSQVHITHLDRRRAVYASATSDLRGGELKNNEEGTVSGTLLLKKCSTLPSKPFSFSLTTPTSEIDPLSEGTDLRLKVLADKAATSPSSELSAAVQRASWDLDASGVFAVHLDLDPRRFTESETEIRWMAKSRYENDTIRATVCEVRVHGSKSRWFEIEFSSKLLNNKLAEYVQLRKEVDRKEVAGIVAEFFEWCSSVVNPFERPSGKASASSSTHV
ncbi:hypothetical protein T439DRAFT_378186 [Meredithblackwellia eburnea MCA 4105]